MLQKMTNFASSRKSDEINFLFYTLGPFWEEEVLWLVPVQHSISPCTWRWSALDGEYQRGHGFNPEEESDVQLLHVHSWGALLAGGQGNSTALYCVWKWSLLKSWLHCNSPPPPLTPFWKVWKEKEGGWTRGEINMWFFSLININVSFLTNKYFW